MLSCNEQKMENREFINDDGLLVRQVFYKDGRTPHLEQSYINDSIPHGYFKSYYPDGSMKAWVEFKDGQKQGRGIFFYQGNRKKQEGWYKNGMADSLWFWYDSLGALTKERFFYRDLYIGQGLDYGYVSGKKYVKRCGYFIPQIKETGETFVVTFDANGNRKSNGVAYLPIDNTNSREFNVNEIFKANIYQCMYYDRELKVTIKILQKSTGKVVDSVSLPLTEVYYYTYRFTAPGEYKMLKVTEENTLSFDIKVTP